MGLGAIVGVVGAALQYRALMKQVEVQERAVEQAAEYLELAKRNYNEISVPTFERVRDFFDYGHTTWRPRVNEFMVEAFAHKDYAPEHDLARGRALSTVTTQFDNARKMRDRARGRYRVGQCCGDVSRFAIAAAQARVAAANVGYRYEDQKAFEIDQWYWNRQTAGGQMAMTGLSNTVSAINGGAGVATTGLSGVGDASRSLTAASGQVADGMNNMASFWGNISNGAFGLVGFGAGRSGATSWGGAPSGGGGTSFWSSGWNWGGG